MYLTAIRGEDTIVYRLPRGVGPPQDPARGPTEELSPRAAERAVRGGAKFVDIDPYGAFASSLPKWAIEYQERRRREEGERGFDRNFGLGWLGRSSRDGMLGSPQWREANPDIMALDKALLRAERELEAATGRVTELRLRKIEPSGEEYGDAVEGMRAKEAEIERLIEGAPTPVSPSTKSPVRGDTSESPEGDTTSEAPEGAEAPTSESPSGDGGDSLSPASSRALEAMRANARAKSPPARIPRPPRPRVNSAPTSIPRVRVVSR